MGIALRHVVKFPANVLGTRGINLVKQNGQYTFKLDYGALNPTASVDPNSLIAYQNPVTGEMGVTTVTAATNSNLNLLSIANADTDTDKLGYWSGENSYALTDLTSFSRTILGSSDATAFKTALGLASAFSGPASATDNAILRFDGTTGKLGKNSSASIDDNGVVSAAGAILDTAANSLDQGLVTSHSGTGSPGARFDFNIFEVTADDIATDEGDDTVSVHRIVHSFGGSNAKGARETLRVEALLTDPTSPSNGNRNYVAGRFDARASAADNGSLPGSPAGALFALNPVAHLSADATGWLEVNGGEVNVGMDSGASVSRRIGWSLVSYGVGNGSFDSALNIGAFSDSVGWGTGINFSDGNGGAPLPSNGTLIASTGSWTVGNGIELSTLDITGNLIRGKGLVTIMGSTSGQVAIGVDDTTGTYVFSLPTSAGTAGYPLLSGGGSTVQTYGILGVAAGGTGDSGTDWSSMGTLSLLAGSGSFGSASAAGWYKQLGKSVLFTIRVDVASIGSAASYFTVGIPWTAKRYLSLSAANPSINNLMCATISDGATSITVTNFNNTSIGIGSGQFVVITGIAVID